MNYADIALGTWYPKGGSMKSSKGMVKLAEEKEFRSNTMLKVGRDRVEKWHRSLRKIEIWRTHQKQIL